MRISCTRTFNFPKPDYNPDHPLFPELAKYPNGFQIGVGQVKDAPEWIMQSWMFDLAQRAGNLVVLASGEPQLEWGIPDGAKADPAFWRGLADELRNLKRTHDESSPSKRPVDGLVAYSESGGAEGSGSWELFCGPSHIQEAFKEIAARGCAAFHLSDDVTPLSCWLHQTWLFLRAGEHKVGHTCRTETGACILLVIQASAAHCSKLAHDVAEMQRNTDSFSLPAQERQILEEHREPKKPVRREQEIRGYRQGLTGLCARAAQKPCRGFPVSR
jgi:hypothetical protein